MKNKRHDGCVMTRQQVRDFDAWAINELGIPGCVLMENAGRNCAAHIVSMLGDCAGRRVVVFCGIGNNGGDGYVIARHLVNVDLDVRVVICGDREKVKGDAGPNLALIEKMNIPVWLVDPSGDDVAQIVDEHTLSADMIVDALFGTGLTGAMRQGYPEIVRSINRCGKPVLSVDIPSGLDCDLGLPTDDDVAIEADITVSFIAMKQGFINEKALRYTGKIIIASIGVEPNGRNVL